MPQNWRRSGAVGVRRAGRVLGGDLPVQEKNDFLAGLRWPRLCAVRRPCRQGTRRFAGPPPLTSAVLPTMSPTTAAVTRVAATAATFVGRIRIPSPSSRGPAVADGPFDGIGYDAIGGHARGDGPGVALSPYGDCPLWTSRLWRQVGVGSRLR
jgi:hypothetical protein